MRILQNETRPKKRPDLTTHASLLGEGFSSKVKLLGSLVQNSHYPSVGRYKERLLAEAIRQYIPEGFKVGNGFVLFPTEHDQDLPLPHGFDPLNMSGHVLSRECDIIVYDATSAPVVFRDGDFVIVRPESVKAVVEVKGNLTPRNVGETLDSFLEFGRKWRATQLFYRDHHQAIASRPSLYFLAWDVATRPDGSPQTDGVKCRKQIRDFYAKNLSLPEFAGMPYLDTGYIYDNCEVGYCVSDSTASGKRIFESGWSTSPGKFVRIGDDGMPFLSGDRTVASLLASIHHDLGTNFNRFFSRVDETRLKVDEIPFKQHGFESWLSGSEEMRAFHSDKPL